MRDHDHCINEEERQEHEQMVMIAILYSEEGLQFI